VIGKHSLLGLFVVLIDNIGDYSLSNIYPQFLSSGSGRLGKSIQKAKIVTQRSQAAVRDTWICKYYYNKRNKLDSLTAASKEEVRFRKKVNYTQASSITIASYRNIEDRQITSRKETYPLTGAWLKLAGQLEETGKNLDTELSATLTKKNLGQIKSLKMSQAEVLKLIR
ncbi:MAG TPA: hypothetical protein VF610_10035, partial [Segetibacter sp.]